MRARRPRGCGTMRTSGPAGAAPGLTVGAGLAPARRFCTGRPYFAEAGATPPWGVRAHWTHPRRQHKRGDYVSSTTRAGRRCQAQGPRPPYRGSGGKRTAGPRRNGCGAVVPPGASPGVSLVPFWTFRKEPAPQGGIPLITSMTRTGMGDGRPLIRHGIRRDTFPPEGGRLLGRLWEPPLQDIFSLCVGARFARPPVPHRPPLFRQGRRGTTVGCACPLDLPAAAAQTGGPCVVPRPRRTPVPCPRPASPVPGDRGKADCGTQAERTWSRSPAGSVTRRLFGSFLDAQKGTRPAGRNPCDKSYDWDRDGRRKTPHPSRHTP